MTVRDWGVFQLHHGDCREVLRAMPENSVDAVVCDPPYGLEFMGKAWDGAVPDAATWREVLRVLKPGGHLLAFAGTRTQHRMATAIEDAGFEIRDMIAWVYGSGFPKSLNVSKALDAAAGAEREQGYRPNEVAQGYAAGPPVTDAARQYDGWGTALKPALEPITVARKPLIGTVAANVLAHGTGGLNVDGCRVPGEVPVFENVRKTAGTSFDSGSERTGETRDGRWPANLVHDGSPDVVAAFPDSAGSGAARTLNRGARPDQDGWGMADASGDLRDAGTGSAARFFYCAKTSKRDRGDGNTHPTVKPTDLMRYLCRLVTPPGGVVLDPFTGSGSTGKAAILEGFRFIGCDLSSDYLDIAERRIAHAAFGDLAFGAAA